MDIMLKNLTRPSKYLAIVLLAVFCNVTIASQTEHQTYLKASPPSKLERDVGNNMRFEPYLIANNVHSSKESRRYAALKKKQAADLLNLARSETRRCGRVYYGVAGRLSFDKVLNRVAQRHARDLASSNRQSHISSNGENLQTRVTQAGVNWQALAENIATGYESAANLIPAWLESPEHCANIMSAKYSRLGLGNVKGYWVLVMAD